MVGEFIQDGRGEYCICGVGDSVRMGSACAWAGRAVLGRQSSQGVDGC